MPSTFGVEASPSGYNYSCYVSNASIPIDTAPSLHFFSERNGYSTLTVDDLRQVTDDINNAELKTSLKELMNRIYKLELEVYELKQQFNQGGTIKL